MAIQTIIGGQGGSAVAQGNPPPPPVAGQPPTPVGDIVTTRDPTPLDDVNGGFSSTNQWGNSSNSKVWACSSNAANAAMWTDVTPTQAPGDLMASQGTPFSVLYATRNPFAAYTGGCVDVIRDGDGATATFGFNTNGSFDNAGLTAFLGALTYAPNVQAAGHVSKWYDLTGNGNHAVQTNPLFMPRIIPSQNINGAPTIISAFVDAPYTSQYMVIPSTVNFAAQSFSVFGVHRSLSAYTASYFWQLSGATNFLAASNVNQANTNFSVYGSGTGKMISTKMPLCSPTILGAVVAPGTNASRLIYDEQTTAGTEAITGSFAGGYLFAGGTAGTPPQFRNNSECVFWGAAPFALTTAQQAALTASINGTFGLNPQVRDTVLIDGDSIAWGNISNLGQVPGELIQPFLSKPMRVVSVATSGDTLLGRNTKYPTLGGATGVFNSASKNQILVSQAATNDLGTCIQWAPGASVAVGTYRFNNGQFFRYTAAGVTAATVNGPTASSGSVSDGTATCVALGGAGALAADIYGRLTTLVASAHATGWKVLVVSPIARGDIPAIIVAERDTYLALCRANAAGADGVCDMGADQLLGPEGAYVNKGIYNIDNLHLISPGYFRFTAIIGGGVNLLLR